VTLRWLIATCALASCIGSNEVPCGDGRVCPPNNTCDDVNHRCNSPEQTAACQSLADGASCTFEGVSGVCDAGACQPLVCGDGIRTGTEACDGSDLGSATCLTAGYYNPDGLACSPFCTFDTTACVGRCGDGIVNGPELCDGSPPDGACIDEGLDAGPLACSASCGASLAECARFGWNAEPLPLSFASAITGTGDDDLWVVGDGGVALHYNGAAWTQVPTGITDDLFRISAAAPDDVWAVGSAEVLHWNGSAWSNASAPGGAYTDIWAGSGVVAAATTTGVVSWNGASWQLVGAYPGTAIGVIRGTGANDLWAADSTELWHWNGTTWSASLAAAAQSISAVAPDDVWLSGSVGPMFESVIAHWNGSTWTQYASEVTDLYTAIVANAPNDVWIGGTGGTAYHFDGGAFTEALALSDGGGGGALASLQSFGPGDIVGLSTDGVVYRYRGQAYVQWSPDLPGPAIKLWLDSGSDVFFADNSGHIAHWDGSSWTGETAIVDPHVVSLFGTGSDNVWATSGSAAYRYAPASGAWTRQASFPFDSETILWGTSASDMWAFGATVAGHYDGSAWTTSSMIAASFATGTSASDVWAAGDDAIAHWDGTSWSAVPSPSADPLVGIASIAVDRVVAADARYVYTWDGTSWSQAFVPVIERIIAIGATAPDQIVVATQTELAQFDGTQWSLMRVPADQVDDPGASLVALAMTPNMYAILVNRTTLPVVVRALLRTKPWVCEAHETECTNGVDDDCDGLIDALDPDCPH
jgi:hypothetical protein